MDLVREVTMPWSLPPPADPRSLEMALTMLTTLAPYLEATAKEHCDI